MPKHNSGRWFALTLLCAAQFMVVLDASIVNVALPSIAQELKLTETQLQWVVNSYVLMVGGFLLLGGRAADLLGRRRLFIIGMALFSTASLIGGLAQSDEVLIGARAVQGLGAALLSPAALSTLTTLFSEGKERNKALGIWGAIAGAGGAVGVLLGGVLTEYLGWEWVLFVNVPIGVIVIALTPKLIPESRRSDERQRFDSAGAFTATGGLVTLVYTVVNAQSWGWASTKTVTFFAVSALLLAAFIVIEQRSRSPLVPFRIFRSAAVTGANVTGLLTGASLFSMFFFVSLYLQEILGYSALKAGLAYLPLAVAIVLSSGAASQLTNRFGARPVLVTGMLLVGGGLLWFTQISVAGSYLGDVLFPSLLAGIGLGFCFVPITIAAVSGVEEHESGLASGLINTSQQIGGALGLAIMVSVSTGYTKSAVKSAESAAEMPNLLAIKTEGFSQAFAVGTGIALLGAVLAYFLLRNVKATATES